MSYIRFNKKQIKELVKLGVAKDVTNLTSKSEIPEEYRKIAISYGNYGINALLLMGEETNTLYAVTARTGAIDILF